MEESNKLLQTLHQQFSENQNHHSGLFIQLLIALFALFGMLGYVIINTSSFNIMNGAKFDNEIPFGLAVALVSLILLLLNKLVLNYGYGFRRDQMINQRIRFKFLKEDGYNKIFGKQYMADNKDKMSYLPAFFSVFFWAIILSQIVLFVILIITMIICNCSNQCYMIPFLVIAIISLYFSFHFWNTGYLKYCSNIKE